MTNALRERLRTSAPLRLLSATLALLLAVVSIMVASPAAHADGTIPGIASSRLELNGDTYNGTDILTEGDTLTLWVQYSVTQLKPGATVSFKMGPGVEVDSKVPAGNTAVQSVTQSGDTVTLTFKNPLPSADQGVFGLNVVVKEVESSGEQVIAWNLGGEHSLTVIVRNKGDKEFTGSKGFAKSGNTDNLDSYVTVEGGKVVLKDTIKDKKIAYTLKVTSTEARNGFTLSDKLPVGMSYVGGSFAYAIEKWDANGLNREQGASTSFVPKIVAASGAAGASFTADLDESLRGPSVLTVTYEAAVTDKAALEAELQKQYDKLGGKPGNFEISLKNIAAFEGVEKTKSVRLRGTVADPNAGPGSGALGKAVDIAKATVRTAEDGTLQPALDLTYTMTAKLSEWNGSNEAKTLTTNMVIGDALPAQARWNEDAEGFVTATGISLSKVGTCPTVEHFAGDAYVGKYCVDGQTLWVNVGKDAKNVTVKAKAQLTTVAGLPTKDRLTNKAEFRYNGKTDDRSVSTDVVVLPSDGEGLEDTSVFAKSGKAQQPQVDVGERATIDYTFTVGAGKGIDARKSYIVDHVDTSVFDASSLASAKVTGKYDGQSLNASHYELSVVDGELRIELTEAGKKVVDTRGADKKWETTISLTTVPFEGKETKEITNKATLFGSDDKPLYWSVTKSDATSYGDEAEVRKRVFDRESADWAQSTKVYTRADGSLVDDGIFTYRVQFIPWGAYNDLKIVPVKDVLPDQVEFVGFVTEADKATGVNPTPGPVDMGGNIEASYKDGVVTISQKEGTKLNAKAGEIVVYFAVKVKEGADLSAPIVNAIGSTSATIDPQEKPSIDIEKWTDEAPAPTEPTGPAEPVEPTEPAETEPAEPKPVPVALVADFGPRYGQNGALLNDGYEGDFDAAPGKELTAGTDQQIRFTVSNDGGEPLVDIVVSDKTAVGDIEIKDLVCVFPDESRGTSWPGPFEPGAQFECTGTLPGLAADATHADTATVTGKGKYTGDTVTDEDDWHGFTPAKPTSPGPNPSNTPSPSETPTPGNTPSPSETPTPGEPSATPTPDPDKTVSPTEPSTPGSTETPAPDPDKTVSPGGAPTPKPGSTSKPGLPSTGSDVSAGLLATSALLISGGLALVARRRRSAE